MSGIAATSPAISSFNGRPARWRTLRLTAIYVAVISALIVAILAFGVAIAPASPAPSEMRLLQPGAGGQTAWRIGSIVWS